MDRYNKPQWMDQGWIHWIQGGSVKSSQGCVSATPRRNRKCQRKGALTGRVAETRHVSPNTIRTETMLIIAVGTAAFVSPPTLAIGTPRGALRASATLAIDPVR